MPLVSGFDLRLTTKAGLTKDASDNVTGWMDQVTETRQLTVPATAGAPIANATLNTADVITFDGVDDILQINDGVGDRGPSIGNFTISYLLIKITPNSTFTDFIIDSGNAADRTGIVRTGDFVVARNAGSSLNATATSIYDIWAVVSVFQGSNADSEIYFNDVLQISGDHSPSSSTGLTIGGIQTLGQNAEFDLVEIVEYLDSPKHTKAEIEQNIAHFESEWGLDLLGPQWKPYTVQGNPVAGNHVIYIIADDRNFTNATIHDIATTNASGEAPPATEIPTGKHVFVVPSYEVPDPAPSGLTIGDTYSEIGKWIDGFPT